MKVINKHTSIQWCLFGYLYTGEHKLTASEHNSLPNSDVTISASQNGINTIVIVVLTSCVCIVVTGEHEVLPRTDTTVSESQNGIKTTILDFEVMCVYFS